MPVLCLPEGESSLPSPSSSTVICLFLSHDTLLLFASFDHGNSPFQQPCWFEQFHPERARLLQLLSLNLLPQLKIFGAGLMLKIFAPSTDATTAATATTQQQSGWCSSQEVYIESLGLVSSYYALAAWDDLCLKTIGPASSSIPAVAPLAPTTAAGPAAAEHVGAATPAASEDDVIPTTQSTSTALLRSRGLVNPARHLNYNKHCAASI
eukprot:jgi/Psemu1/47002/gm1.47002_g